MADGYQFAIKCVECNKEFATKNAFERHLKLVHASVKPYGCDLCSFKTANRSYLKSHRKQVHKRLRAHSCPYDGCTSSFADEWNLVRHIDKSHLGKRQGKHTVQVHQLEREQDKTKPKTAAKKRRVTRKVKKLPQNPPAQTINIY
jgi:uncharacterized Zn-finger protein